jgi:dihydrolipoamide dehydrogenase
MENYDVAVIGGGPGGYVCAIRCAQEGLKTVLIEKEHLGGTCLNWGCIPTKSLLQSAKVYSSAKKSKEFGILCKEIEFDFSAIMKRKDDVVSKLRRGIEGLVKGNGCTIVSGTASFIDKNTLAVGATQIKFKNAVIATGSVPSSLNIDGLENVNWVNSDGFLSLEKLPKSVLIVGTGVIGLEFATFLNAMDVQVSMVDILPQIAGNVDTEIANSLQEIMEKRGVQFHLDAKIKKFEQQNSQSVCHFEKNGIAFSEAVEMVIMATGRRPNTSGLNVENIGMKTEKGFLCVDDYCATNIQNIYAIGDVNGKAMLAHAASEQGMVVAHNLCKDKKQKADFSLIPSCIYTEPEIATIGLDENKAKNSGIDTLVGKFNVNGNGKSLVMGETEGLVKVVADKKTGEVLGLQLFNSHATDMIGEGLLALKLESTLEEISDAIHPHPTVNEMIMEAVHDALGHCAHKINPRK